jgi:hypothetical protein
MGEGGGTDQIPSRACNNKINQFFSRIYFPKQIHFLFILLLLRIILITHHDRWQNKKYELYRVVQKSLLRPFLVLNIENKMTFASPSIFYYTRVRVKESL